MRKILSGLLFLAVAATAHAATIGAGPSGGVPSKTFRIPSSVASTNASVVKASPGRVYKIVACNIAASYRYVKFYDKATTPVPGTDPVVSFRPLPPSSCASFDWSAIGMGFNAGIALAITTGVADTDTTAPSANDITAFEVDYE